MADLTALSLDFTNLLKSSALCLSSGNRLMFLSGVTYEIDALAQLRFVAPNAQFQCVSSESCLVS